MSPGRKQPCYESWKSEMMKSTFIVRRSYFGSDGSEETTLPTQITSFPQTPFSKESCRFFLSASSPLQLLISSAAFSSLPKLRLCDYNRRKWNKQTSKSTNHPEDFCKKRRLWSSRALKLSSVTEQVDLKEGQGLSFLLMSFKWPLNRNINADNQKVKWGIPWFSALAAIKFLKYKEQKKRK